MPVQHVARNIRFYRIQANISQKEIALTLDISQQHYSMMEKGKRPVSIEFAFIIARYLRINPICLFEQEQNHLPKKPHRQEKNLLTGAVPQHTLARMYSCYHPPELQQNLSDVPVTPAFQTESSSSDNQIHREFWKIIDHQKKQIDMLLEKLLQEKSRYRNTISDETPLRA